MIKINTLFLVSTLLISSCIKNTHISGAASNISVAQELPNLSKDEVINKLGSPTVINYKFGETWAYISDVYEKKAFLHNKVTKQNVLIVKFNGDKVSDAKYYGEEELKPVKYSKLSTPSFGDDTTLLKEMFSNLGRFNVRKGNQTK
ncbi:MAG: outer membrane protein assembly factor BamE [Alphaproteobacteria bacterium]|nr:outer membrane protein assembly factor BamE [Alphaproteobacteria bacterium]OJV13867.1 MAG: hypothetical protein BGO27_08225 [Alphaproteobacteria bacterium 33-17]